MVIIDTNIAIYLRDAEPDIGERLAGLDAPPAISVITLVELEAGVRHDARSAVHRRNALTEMLAELLVLPFGPEEAAVYGRIVAEIGYARTHVLDRMIAAQAIVAEARFITINGRDFAGIPGLDLEVWPSPA